MQIMTSEHVISSLWNAKAKESKLKTWRTADPYTLHVTEQAHW